MNLQFYFEKLKNSDEFLRFEKENPNAYFCGGFFIVDKEGSDNKVHLDFWVPASSSTTPQLESALDSDKSNLPRANSRPPIPDEGENNKTQNPKNGEVISFQFDNEGISLVPVESQGDKIPEKISEDVNFGSDYVEKLVIGEMFEQKIDKKIQKIILSLQGFNGRVFLVGTIFVSGLGLLKIKIDVEDMQVVDFEKKSFMDMVWKKG